MTEQKPFVSATFFWACHQTTRRHVPDDSILRYLGVQSSTSLQTFLRNVLPASSEAKNKIDKQQAECPEDGGCTVLQNVITFLPA
jgi:hypothetical protein